VLKVARTIAEFERALQLARELSLHSNAVHAGRI
jgi:hypothetical protein